MTLSAVGGTLTAAGGTVTVSGDSTPANPVQVQRANSAALSSGTSVTATLPSGATEGNTILLVVKSSASTLADYATPAGYTEITSHIAGTTACSFKLFAKEAAGGEQAIEATFDATVSNARSEAQEWSGLPMASMLDATNSVTGDEAAATSTSWDPASVTVDQDRAVYLCILALSAGSGSVTSAWAGGVTDDFTGTSHMHVGHKIVTDGSALDTAISWTNARAFAGGVLSLRGES